MKPLIESGADWLRAHPGRRAKLTGWTPERGWVWTDDGPLKPKNQDPVAWAEFNAAMAARPLEH